MSNDTLTSINLFHFRGQENAFKVRIAAKAAGITVNSTILNGPADVPKGQVVPFIKCEKTGWVLSQSNAIIRMLARAGKGANLYGKEGDYQAQAQVDQWLEFLKTEVENPAGVVVHQIFGHLPYDAKDFNVMSSLVSEKLQIIEKHLAGKDFLVGDALTLADVSLVTTCLNLFRFHFHKKVQNKKFKNLTRVFTGLTQSATFTAVLGRVFLCQQALNPRSYGNPAGGDKQQKQKKEKKGGNNNQKGGKGKGGDKKASNQPKKAAKKSKSKRPKHWAQALPKSKFDMMKFKTTFFNCTEEEEPAVWENFWNTVDLEAWSFWKIGYEQPRPGELQDPLKTMNLLGMFTQKIASFGKFMIGTMGVYGTTAKQFVRGVWMIRGQECERPELQAVASWEFYTKTKLDAVKDRALIMEYWTKTTTFAEPEVLSEPDSESEDDSSEDSTPKRDFTKDPLDPGHAGDKVENNECLDIKWLH